MEKAAPLPAILSARSLTRLAERLAQARREMCERGECDCVTEEEHAQNLARKT